jgi:hypothetical protein
VTPRRKDPAKAAARQRFRDRFRLATVRLTVEQAREISEALTPAMARQRFAPIVARIERDRDAIDWAAVSGEDLAVFSELSRVLELVWPDAIPHYWSPAAIRSPMRSWSRRRVV